MKIWFISEFIPYVFQILSMLLEYTPPGAIPEPYMQLLPCLLAPVLWERPANVSPLVRLLSAFAVLAAPQIVAQDKLVRKNLNRYYIICNAFWF